LAAVKVTAQEAVAPLPDSVHVVEEKLLARLAEKVIITVGVVGVPELVSVTTAVQVRGTPLWCGAGQYTEVEDERCVTDASDMTKTRPSSWSVTKTSPRPES